MRTRAVLSSMLAVFVTLVAASCGDVSKDPPADAVDTAGDMAPDTMIDVSDTLTTDIPPDAPVDTLTDTSLDATTDPGVDDLAIEPDALDLPDGWPTENPTDWPYTTTPQCRGPGGFCSGGRDILCPWGYELIEDADPNRRCEDDGWCCVVAPYSECTDSGVANCVWDGDCTSASGGCWGDASPVMECEAGRVCCVDTCT